MAEIALLSNQSSSLYASSKSSGGSDKSAYIYDMRQSSVNKFRERFIETPLNPAQPTFGGSATCELPAFGILKQMVLKTTINYRMHDTSAAPILSRALFSQLIDQVSIKNSSRELQVLYGDCLKYLVYNLGTEQSKKWRLVGLDNVKCADKDALSSDQANAVDARYNGVIGLSAEAAGNDITIYTILPFSMFHGFGSSSEYKNLLNTRFLERLSVDVRFNAREAVLNAKAANGASGGFHVEPTIKSCSLDTPLLCPAGDPALGRHGLHEHSHCVRLVRMGSGSRHHNAELEYGPTQPCNPRHSALRLPRPFGEPLGT